LLPRLPEPEEGCTLGVPKCCKQLPHILLGVAGSAVMKLDPESRPRELLRSTPKG